MVLFLLSLLFYQCFSNWVLKEPNIHNIFPPQDWVLESRPSSESKIALVIALHQSNLEKLEELLFKVSDPKSVDYGKHLSADEVNALTAPPQHAIDAVLSYLARFRADVDMEMHSHYGMIRTTVPLAVAESMLNAHYFTFSHVSGATVVRTANYSLPADVAQYISVVGPTIRFPPIRRAKFSPPMPLDNTPASLRVLYNVGNTVGQSSKSRQAVTAFLQQYMSDSDLQIFYKLYFPQALGQEAVIVGPNLSPPGIEANLDIQYMTVMGANITTEFDSFPGTAPDNPANEPFLDMLYYLGNDTNPPWTVSSSYGEDESSVSMDYANSCNTEFQKNGVRGISLMFASGDSGVGSDTGACTRFVAQWPSASPYVTAVGGTTGTGPEIGAGLSSGGFSDRWPQQPWQKQAIEIFFQTSPPNDLPDPSRFNPNGRGFPDVAAQATGFTIVFDGSPLSGVAGTSCACPTFSGIVGLLNDLRLGAGKTPLGFLNPMLYQSVVQSPQMFQDIISGDNPGCGTKGFTAIRGWDPVTGLGTPNYVELAKVVTNLP